MKLGGCHACETCYKNGKLCSFDDDFNLIAPAILESDVVVFAMPTYWFSIPSNIKAVLDRMYCFLPGGKLAEVGGKQAALIACCMDDQSAMDGITMPFEKSFALLGWENIGEVLVPGVGAVGDVKKTDGCQRAAALADKL
jgi:multimeric flavodoxin WrbA